MGVGGVGGGNYRNISYFLKILYIFLFEIDNFPNQKYLDSLFIINMTLTNTSQILFMILLGK